MDGAQIMIAMVLIISMSVIVVMNIIIMFIIIACFQWCMWKGALSRPILVSGNSPTSDCETIYYVHTWEDNNRTSWHEKSKASEMSITMECVARRQSRQRKIQNKHRKNCECCPVSQLIDRKQRLSLIQVLNCQYCNQCLKCHKSLGSLL